MAKTLQEKFHDGTLSLKINVTRLDAAAARDFKAECAAVWHPGVERLEIDLAEVDFLDSSGVGALLSVLKRLPAEKPGVKLINVRPPVQAVIELLRLHRIFEIQS